MDEDNYNYIKMIRIPHIHRALSVSSDLKGRNFAIVQANPKIGGKEFPLIKTSDMKQNMKALFEDAKFDNFHDVVFEVIDNFYSFLILY